MKLAQTTYSRVEEYLKSKTSIIIPIGSTEQHSPVGLLGTDHLIAEEIAYKVGEKSNTLVSPTVVFGMSNHHLAFPGTISLNPTTLISVVKDILFSLHHHGFKRFFFVNGHGGNTPSVLAAISEVTRELDIQCKIVSWWILPEIAQLSQELFGDKEGHHATPSEISVTIYFYKDSFQKTISNFIVDHPKYNWPLSPSDFKKQFPDGCMESDPSLATFELGKQIFEKAVSVIQKEFIDFENV